jgi:uncharacterized protein (TIGR00369 family)
MTRLERGVVEIDARNRKEFSQQDGLVHGGVLATLMDSAGGYAVLSLMPPGSRVLAVEFKINFMAPGRGEMIRGSGRVRRIGRRIAVCELEAKARTHKTWTTCAWGSETVYCIRPGETNG